MIQKIKKLNKNERQLFLNLIDEILFDRDVGDERVDLLLDVLVKANCTREEIVTFLEVKK